MTNKLFSSLDVALLTGGSDRPYVYGLATALSSKGLILDLVGSDELDLPEIRNIPGVNFLNLRGDQRQNAPLLKKIIRIVIYYYKLLRYAATAKPKLFHILWNNKFEAFDRTFLMLYYRLLGKCLVLTAHNVNERKRDREDSLFNRLTLRIQYHLAHNIFVHTEMMKRELQDEFGVPSARLTVIPFGMNNFAPNTTLTPCQAKQQLGIRQREWTILFFGRITPYKGIEYLIDAFQRISQTKENCRLIIAGRLDAAPGEQYWNSIRERVTQDVQTGRLILKTEYIAEDQTEVYFKAADVLVLPYTSVYQSGVLFLGHSFGLPVIVSGVGSLKDDIVEGETGFVFRPKDPVDLARAIETYFESNLYADLNTRRKQIAEQAAGKHSWDLVSDRTLAVYLNFVKLSRTKNLTDSGLSKESSRQTR